MSAHTPGPWRAKQFDESQMPIFSDDPENGLICTVSTGSGRVHGKENAALIAAAPDILATLKELMYYAETGEHMPSNVRADARAALAKAEGRAES